MNNYDSTQIKIDALEVKVNSFDLRLSRLELIKYELERLQKREAIFVESLKEFRKSFIESDLDQ